MICKIYLSIYKLTIKNQHHTKVAYVVNYVVPSYATLVYSQCIFGRCLISVFYFQKFYVPLHS